MKTVLLIFLLIPVLVLFQAMGSRRKLKRQRKRYLDVAEALSMTYVEGLDRTLRQELSESYLVSERRHSGWIHDVLTRQESGHDALLFTMTYSRGASNMAARRHLAVVYFRAPRLSLPRFKLCYDGPRSPNGEAAPDWDSFLNHCRIECADPEQLRARFSGGLIGFLAAHPGLYVEGGRGYLLCYYDLEEFSPEELPQRLEDASRVFEYIRQE